LFDKLQRRCVACCLQGNLGGYSKWQKHKTMQCKAHAGMTGLDLDQFQQGIHNQGGIHSCRRCWVSQKYCATRESIENRCQWPNVVVPLARTAATTDVGEQIIQEKCGYAGKLEED
jgi:hypothetical protein